MKLQEQNNGQKLVTVPRDLAKAMGWEIGMHQKSIISNFNYFRRCPFN